MGAFAHLIQISRFYERQLNIRGPRGKSVRIFRGVKTGVHLKTHVLWRAPFGLSVTQTRKKITPFLRVSPEIVPPCREPTISGDTIGARARATALRHLCGAANYATCNAPASRRDGALPAYDTSSPRHSLRRRRTCKRSFRPCASFGWAAPAPNKCTSCIRTLRMRRYNANSMGVWGNNSPTERRTAKRRADYHCSSHTSCY